MSEVFNNDVNHFLQLNDVVKQANSWGGGNTLRTESNKIIKAFDATVIQPSLNMDLGNSLVANKKLIEVSMKYGQQMAESVFNLKKI
ncbi:MAG: hypothetical protein N4A35_17100 [Flavobacteriales bacterium]|jgi:hypothetical protein|nr:hypothetical protein [Flavobacteriales bacterium]